MKSRAKIAVILLLMGMGLSACGVRGSLQQPADERAARKTQASAEERDPREPDKRFILDGLIR